MSSTLNTYVPVLEGPNYQKWAAAMQSYLMSQGQWCVIKTQPSPPEISETVTTSGEGKEAVTTKEYSTDALEAWEELNTKAVGNIRLRLHHTIAYQYNSEERASTLWVSLAEKYGNPSLLRAYIEFKGMMDTTIPNNSDPFPTIDKIMSHHTVQRFFSHDPWGIHRDQIP